MKILVTGGSGFVGSHLTRKLLDDGHSVVVVDNLYTGRKENLQDCLDHPNFRFHDLDISREEFFKVMTNNYKFDQIYNLACPASPPHYQKDPLFTTKTCTIGVFNVMDVAYHNKSRVLQASTSEVYGDPEVHPQPKIS